MYWLQEHCFNGEKNIIRLSNTVPDLIHICNPPKTGQEDLVYGTDQKAWCDNFTLIFAGIKQE